MYNDSMWFVDQLREYILYWESRNDLPSRAYGMMKLEPEIKALQGFGKRAYTNEMISQRTVINDFMGGMLTNCKFEIKLRRVANISKVDKTFSRTLQRKDLMKQSKWSYHIFVKRPKCGKRSCLTLLGRRLSDHLSTLSPQKS